MGRATAAAVAVHWTPVAPLRLGLTAERTVFEPFGGVGAAPDAETVVVLRAQVEL